MAKKEKKETYQLNIYKLQNDTLNNYKTKIVSAITGDERKKIVANGIDKTNEVFYLSYSVINSNEGIKWFIKWKEFFKLGKDAEMRSGSKTGHGLLLFNLSGQVFAIVFGRSVSLIKNYIDDEYGMDMAEKLLDNNTIKTKASKFFNLTKNKALVDYNGNQYSSFEESEAADLFNAKIREHIDKRYSTENYITQILDYIRADVSISFANIKVTANNKKIELATVKKILELLVKIETTYRIVYQFPRMHNVSKHVSDTLNSELFKNINENENQYVDYAIPFYNKDNSDNYIFLHGIENIKICFNHKTLWDENSFLGFDIKSKINTEGITDLTNITVKITTIGGSSTSDLLKWLDADLEYKGKQYALNNGKWVTFNKNYVKKINDGITKLPDSLCITKDEYSITKSELDKHYNNNKLEIEKLDKTPYRELIYNHKLSIDKSTNNYLFDRILFNNLEVCDVYQQKEKALLHVKFGNTGAFEACLRQSLLGAKLYFSNKIDICEKENSAKQRIGDVEIISVLFLSNKDFDIRKTKSIKFKQTLISWYNTIIEMKYKPRIIIAKYYGEK